MERMYGEYLGLVQGCISFARKFIILPECIEIYFDDCPSDRFKTLGNAAEGCGNKLYFNKQWFTEQDRWDNHKDDIEFFAFHELRHLYQWHEIELLQQNQIIHEDKETIVLWEDGFKNYIRNEDKQTQDINVMQEVEIDANAYAWCLCNLLHISDGVNLQFSIPTMVRDLAKNRSKMYYEKYPELKRFLDKRRRDAGQLTLKKIGRNDRCPCGSGKKFKRCCIGLKIYD